MDSAAASELALVLALGSLGTAAVHSITSVQERKDNRYSEVSLIKAQSITIEYQQYDLRRHKM